jgi:hypothetical protein
VKADDGVATGLHVSDQLGNTVFALGAIALGLPVIALAARSVQHRGLGTLSSVRGRLRLRWLAPCVAVAAVLCVVQVVADLLIAATRGGAGQEGGAAAWPGAGLFAKAMVLLLILVPLQSAAEEYFAAAGCSR